MQCLQTFRVFPFASPCYCTSQQFPQGPSIRDELLNIVGPEAGDADGTLRRLSAALGIAPRVGREAYHRDYARLNPGAFFRTSYTGRTGADTFPLTPRR
jgi:hypothetical protein